MSEEILHKIKGVFNACKEFVILVSVEGEKFSLWNWETWHHSGASSPPLILLPVIWITAIWEGLDTNCISVILQHLQEGPERLHQLDSSTFAHFEPQVYSVPYHFMLWGERPLGIPWLPINSEAFTLQC